MPIERAFNRTSEYYDVWMKQALPLAMFASTIFVRMESSRYGWLSMLQVAALV